MSEETTTPATPPASGFSPRPILLGLLGAFGLLLLVGLAGGWLGSATRWLWQWLSWGMDVVGWKLCLIVLIGVMGYHAPKVLRLHRTNVRLFWGLVLIGLLLIVCLIGADMAYDPVTARMNAEGRRNLSPWFWPWLQAIGHAVVSLLTNGTWEWTAPSVPKEHFYWLGTDASGQSILLLLIEGTEAFFVPGLMATCIALVGGVTLGSFSGFYGGWIAYSGRYLVTLINSFPNLILVLLCTAVFGPNMTLIAIIVGITFVPHIAEEIRRKVAQLKAEEFVMAAHAHGLRDRQILFYHIVWLHCAALVLRQLVFLWGYLIILETSLNYLGRGVLQEGVSWGKMLYDYRSGLFRGQYWSPLVVTAVVMVTMAGFYLLAEGLQRRAQQLGPVASEGGDA